HGSVDQHVARTALALAAPEPSASQAEVVAQQIDERCSRIDVDVMTFAVDNQPHARSRPNGHSSHGDFSPNTMRRNVRTEPVPPAGRACCALRLSHSTRSPDWYRCS